MFFSSWVISRADSHWQDFKKLPGENLFNFGQSWNKFERSSRHSSASNGKLSASSWLRMNEHTAHCSPHFVECTLCAATLSLTLKRFFPFCCYCAAATTMKSIHAIDISTKKYAVYTSLSLALWSQNVADFDCCVAVLTLYDFVVQLGELLLLPRLTFVCLLTEALLSPE